MNERLRIAIAEDDADHGDLLQVLLKRMGHEIAGVAQTGRDLISVCRSCHPDLVITDIRMPDMDGLEAAEVIYDDRPVPIIVVTSFHDPEFVRRAGQQHILAFLVKPVERADLNPAITIVRCRFEEYELLRRENALLAQALKDRKIIERAKGLLMRQAGIDEEAAFQRIRKLARDQRKKIAEISQMIVTASHVMEA